MQKFCWCFLGSLLSLVACSSDGSSNDSAGTGGTASGGSPSAGGGPSAGGATSTGGAAGSGTAGAAGTGTAGDTWSTFAQTWFSSYCTECHSGGTRNYTAIAEVRRDAAKIRCGVAPTRLAECTGSPAPSQFPVGAGLKPTDMERERLVAWIDAGLPE